VRSWRGAAADALRWRKCTARVLAALCGIVSACLCAQAGAEPEACERVAAAANRGALDTLRVPSAPYDDPSLPDPGDFGGVTFRAWFDIDGDGTKERVYVLGAGTGLLVGKGSGEPVGPRPAEDQYQAWDAVRLVDDVAVLDVDGVPYVLGASGDYLRYLSRVGADGVETLLCSFAQREKALERLVEGRGNPVCEAALQGGLDYVPFDRLHALTSEDLMRAGIEQTSVDELAARVDIDNDGHEDTVVVTQLASGAGSGCDRDDLALLDLTRTRLADTPAAGVLAGLGGGCSGERLRPFRHDGTTWIEHRYDERHPTPVHAIHVIRNGTSAQVCAFEVRVQNYVPDPYELLLAAAESEGRNPWAYAIEQPGGEEVERLIGAGRDLNEPFDEMFCPLSWAVRKRRDDLLARLLEAGADPNRFPPPIGPLYVALWDGTPQAVKLLLARGATLQMGGTDPVMETVRFDNAAKLAIVLQAGIRVGPEHLAYAREQSPANPEIIRLLDDALHR